MEFEMDPEQDEPFELSPEERRDIEADLDDLAAMRTVFSPQGVKGVVIGQLLVAIIGVGELFEVYSNNFLMEEFWALVVVVFLFAFAISEAIAYLERRVEYYAASR